MKDMLYEALMTATEAHQFQKDKSETDYIWHPVYLALQMDTEEEKIVALLHDVIEDSNFTAHDLLNSGFNCEVVSAVHLLTKRTGENYFDYIRRIKDNSLARKVKLADLKHNSDLSRLTVVSENDLKRTEKYQKAIKILEDS